MAQSAGPVIVIVGIVLVVVGLLVWSGLFSWIGRLPGDIHIDRPGFRLYIPITTMIVVSLILSAILALVRRLR